MDSDTPKLGRSQPQETPWDCTVGRVPTRDCRGGKQVPDRNGPCVLMGENVPASPWARAYVTVHVLEVTGTHWAVSRPRLRESPGPQLLPLRGFPERLGERLRLLALLPQTQQEPAHGQVLGLQTAGTFCRPAPASGRKGWKVFIEDKTFRSKSVTGTRLQELLSRTLSNTHSRTDHAQLAPTPVLSGEVWALITRLASLRPLPTTRGTGPPMSWA